MSSSNLVCGKCGKIYKSKAWFDKHVLKCVPTTTNDQSHESIWTPFDFEDNYFVEELDTACELTTTNQIWVSKLSEFTRYNQTNKSSNFFLIHLNINSLFTKTNHIFDLLSHVKPDILALNETKLGHEIPDSAVNPANPANYCLLRRDRIRGGGGVAIYIKKGIKILNSFVSNDFELIHVKLLINKKILHFISAYKPPREKDETFLDYLDTILCSINVNEDIVVTGDLNMDMLTDKGQLLKDFCLSHSLSNRVELPTRVANRRQGDTFSNSCTLIDVVLENKKKVLETTVVDFPFSDHKIIAARLNLPRIRVQQEVKLSRKLNKGSLEPISNNLKCLDLSILDTVADVNVRWCAFKSVIINVVDTYAPLQRSKQRK